MGPIVRLSLAFIAVKLIHVALVILVPQQFDISTELFLQNEGLQATFLQNPVQWTLQFLNRRFLARLVTWDAVYFADLFQENLNYEHQYVFCPLWWRLVSRLPSVNTLNSKVWLATILSNVCHWLAMVVLYRYTRVIFEQARLFNPQQIAFVTAFFYALLPASAFLLAPYSESIASLFSFLCLYLREEGARFQVGYSETLKKAFYIISGAAAALAFGFRANCLLLGIVYLYDLVRMKPEQKWLPLFAGLILGLGFLISNLYNYFAICHGSDRGEWCSSTFPSLFAYAQSHYWNVGFFKYWTPNNIPNFAFGAPTIFLSGMSITYFSKYYPIERITAVSLVNLVFLAAACLFWHVQIVTRVHTFLPSLYWFSAGVWLHNDFGWLKWAILAYFVVWSLVLPLLFGAFLPPA